MSEDKKEEQPQETQPIIVQTTWAKATQRVLTTAIVVGGMLAFVFGMAHYGRQCVRTPVDTAQATGEALKQIGKAFLSGSVKTEFSSSVTTVRGTNRLQIAELEETETFSKTSSYALWDLIGLPDVVVEIQAPAKFTFFVDLDGEWEFTWDESDQTVTIVAPDIEWNTPSIDVSRMRVTREQGSLMRLDEDDVREKLRKEITSIAEEKARQKVPIIRELARNEIRRFVHNWFTEVWFKDAVIKPHVHEVHFAGEMSPEAYPGRTIEMDNGESLS